MGIEEALAILFRVKAKPGKGQKLLKFLKRDCEVCMRELGTLRFDVLQDPASEEAFYIRHAESCRIRGVSRFRHVVVTLPS